MQMILITKKKIFIAGYGLSLVLSLLLVLTAASSVGNSEDERDICEISLQLMRVLGNCRLDDPCCEKISSDKGIFTVLMYYVEEDAGRIRRKWKPAFKQGYICENAKFHYLHQEDALPKQMGALIGIEHHGKEYEFDFKWGRIVPTDEIFLCGKFTGKASKASSGWLLDCNVIDCSKPPENENKDSNITHERNSLKLDSVRRVMGDEKIPGTRQIMGPDAGGGRD